MLRRILFQRLFNNRGENEGGKSAEGAAGKEAAAAAPTTFSQTDVDRIVQDRLNRDRAKYADYEDLRNKVTEYEKHKEQLTQQELEGKKEYEKLKEGWNSKENEYKTKLTEITTQVQSERMSNTLNQEILKKNAYPEAAQLLKSMAKYNDDGSITIRGKDANGMEADLPVAQGVEQFLKDRPYLVKGSGQGGGGTGGNAGQGSTGPTEDLGQALQNAMRGGDRKSINDIKGQIRAKHASGGIVQIL